jgi:hypothetical protein
LVVLGQELEMQMELPQSDTVVEVVEQSIKQVQEAQQLVVVE